jgi:hypothetical protein
VPVQCNGLAADKTAAHAHLGNFDLLEQQHGHAALEHCSFVQKPLAGVIVLKMDQTTAPHQELSGQQRKLSQDANLVRRVHLRFNCHC